jgi:hypothetical protein
MIVSIHISKTAGTSFKNLLHAQFGARMFTDYGDLIGSDAPEAIVRRRKTLERTRRRRRKIQRAYDVIHGHFIADKYADLFPDAKFVAFFRDPYQQTISTYRYIARNPGIDHPLVKAVHQNKMTLSEFISFAPNPQTAFVGRLAIEDFAVIGLTEDFYRSIKLFNATFGTTLDTELHDNTNPDRGGPQYEIGPDLRRQIAIYRAEDMELYERAKREFSRQIAARSI